MKVTIIGPGLIGGSMARDLRKAGVATHLIGVDRDPIHAEKALELKLVDEVLTLEEALPTSDLVIVSIPVNAIQQTILAILSLIDDKTTVIDAGSTKSQICDIVREHPRRKQFVAAHPIAGTENSGPTAALDGLFKNKMNIICDRELSGEAALSVAERVFQTLGMKTIFMEAKEHDKHVAYVSHLSHVSSFLLGQTVLDIEKDEKNIFALAGSGFASTVRLAKSSPDMWAPIFEQNSKYLKKALEEYIAHLQRFHSHLVNHETEKLYEIMVQANEIRRVLSGIELNQATPVKQE
ncbi:MAG TPA: prephenate dehydrogenase [Cyclobacteriaceae bacterium]|nr:prephenate dehydrogenase [Cyclobacteriaceae bacterium]